MLDAPHARYTSTEVPGTGLHILDLAVKIKKKNEVNIYSCSACSLADTIITCNVAAPPSLRAYPASLGEIVLLISVGKIQPLELKWAKFKHDLLPHIDYW